MQITHFAFGALDIDGMRACHVVLGLTLALFACGGRRPADLGLVDGRLAPCPPTPNCVSSDAPDAEHHVDAFVLAVPPDPAWRAAQEEVARIPRTTIDEASATYLHAECTSALLRFVDDLELQLRAAEGRIDVRSASRVGRSDLGVNRARVEALRAALRTRGVVR